MAKRIKKIKITKENRINMAYESKSKNGFWDEYSFTCSEPARPEFYKAIKDLAEHVVEMCELPNAYLNRIEVKGVSFSYGGEAEVMGATISAQMELYDSNQALNINTPNKISDSYSDAPADPKQLLTDDCIKDLFNLEKEAELYIKGDRAQGTLFSKEPEKAVG